MADKFKIVARLGNAADVPLLINGEIGYDVDAKRFRVGDDTGSPPIIPTTKTVGAVEFSPYFSPLYTTINIRDGGTVGGVRIKQMNIHEGVVYRDAGPDGEIYNRELVSSGGYLDFETVDPPQDAPAGTTRKLNINPSERLMQLIAAGGGNAFTYGPNAPATSKPGDEWYCTTDDILYKLIGENNDTAYWMDISSFTGGGGGNRFFITDELPTNASPGDEWYDQDEEKIYKCILSEGRQIWVDTRF